jgi:hypothetical protein
MTTDGIFSIQSRLRSGAGRNFFLLPFRRFPTPSWKMLTTIGTYRFYPAQA